MDYIANGTLKDLIASKGKTLTNAQCIGIAHDIAVGMEFLTTQPQASLHIHDNFKVRKRGKEIKREKRKQKKEKRIR